MSGGDEGAGGGGISLRAALAAPALDLDFFSAALQRALESSPAEADAELVPAPWPGDVSEDLVEPSGLDEFGTFPGERPDMQGLDQAGGGDNHHDASLSGHQSEADHDQWPEDHPGMDGYPGHHPPSEVDW